MKIGVFDSGVGGLSVATAIKKEITDIEVTLVEDKKNLPYGTKTPNQLLKLVTPLLKSMVNDGCNVIVIACNTVTTNIISELREIIEVPLVGMEPMIKPASELTRTGVIGVCATPATLKSKRYQDLKNSYAKNLQVIEPDCSEWAEMIEANDINRMKIIRILNMLSINKADVIVLGCTHYHWIEGQIKSYVGNEVNVIQPEEATIRQLKRVISQLP